jgi:hypothetical protein
MLEEVILGKVKNFSSFGNNHIQKTCSRWSSRGPSFLVYHQNFLHLLSAVSVSLPLSKVNERKSTFALVFLMGNKSVPNPLLALILKKTEFFFPEKSNL